MLPSRTLFNRLAHLANPKNFKFLKLNEFLFCINSNLKKREEKPMAELFTKEQIVEHQNAFTLFDKNKDGVINVREMQKTLSALGIDFTEPEIKEIMKEAGPRVEELDFNQFINIVARKQLFEEVEKELLFDKIFDIHDKGFLTEEVVRHVLTNVGDKFTDEQVDEWLKEADFDGDGLINKDDFYRMMLSK